MDADIIIKLGIGLVGVIIGFFLTFLKEVWFKRKEKQKELEYLTIRLTCAFDKFIAGCFEVVHDDGLYQGQLDKDGCRHTQAKTPNIEPETLDVNWKVLPSKLMYKVLNFPLEIEHSNGVISSIAEHVAFPPYYEEYFEERHYQYSNLGLIVFEINKELRMLGKLPDKSFGEWDSPQKMKSLNVDAIKSKELREEQQRKAWEKMNTQNK